VEILFACEEEECALPIQTMRSLTLANSTVLAQ